MTGERLAYIREAEDGSWEIVAGPVRDVVVPDDPSEIPIAAIRLEIGKDESEKYLTDDDLAYVHLMQGSGNVLLTAAFCCDKIAAQLLKNVDKSMAGSSVSLSQKAQNWITKAEELRRRAMNPTITPRFSSSTAPTRKFAIGQHDFYPGVTDNWRQV